MYYRHLESCAGVKAVYDAAQKNAAKERLAKNAAYNKANKGKVRAIIGEGSGYA